MKRVPIVKQRDIRDCGPCCILSILKYYNGNVPIEKIRLDAFTNNSGTTAYHMVNTLKKYGFDSYGAEVSKENINTIVLPAICLLNLSNGYNHYVVIYKIDKKNVYVMDPFKGYRKYSKEEFYNIYSKVVIICHPQSNYVTCLEDNDIIKFISKLIINNKKNIIYLFLFGLIVTIFNIVNSFYFKIAYNFLNDNILLFINISFFLFLLIKIVFNYWNDSVKNYIERDINYNLNFEFLEHFFNLPSNIVKNRTSGEISTRVSELNNLHLIITEIVMNFILNSILAISAFIVLYFINSILLKYVILLICIYIGICIIGNKLLYKKIMDNIESNTKYNEIVLENCETFNSIKNNHIEIYRLDKTKNTLNDFLFSNFNLNRFINRLYVSKSFVIDTLYYLIVFSGILLIKEDKLSIVDYITFTTILGYLIDPIKNIVDVIPKFNYLKASLVKIMDFNSLPVEKFKRRDIFYNGDIIIKNLCFSYNDFHKVINNLDLTIKEKEHVLLKGKSGCGKSSLCKIINRTNKNYSGEIKINDININEYDLSTIRSNIGYLSQNENLFCDTIKNNIILNKKFDLKKFNYVCKLCFLEEFIRNKPLGYETTVNLDNCNLSGGEMQRIILARALYNKYKILILDEALSEVNIDLEEKIIKNLHKYCNNITLIYVSHKKHDKLFKKIINVGDNSE